MPDRLALLPLRSILPPRLAVLPLRCILPPRLPAACPLEQEQEQEQEQEYEEERVPGGSTRRQQQRLVDANPCAGSAQTRRGGSRKMTSSTGAAPSAS